MTHNGRYRRMKIESRKKPTNTLLILRRSAILAEKKTVTEGKQWKCKDK